MHIKEFQQFISGKYEKRDRQRGVPRTCLWFVEEVGELAKALRQGDRDQLAGEFADVFAWLCTLASITGVSLEEAVRKYARGCPKCGHTPCACPG